MRLLFSLRRADAQAASAYVAGLQHCTTSHQRAQRIAQTRNAGVGGRCPISHTPLLEIADPYIAEDNVTYERTYLAFRGDLMHAGCSCCGIVPWRSGDHV
jgi:hypothetical protein